VGAFLPYTVEFGRHRLGWVRLAAGAGKRAGDGTQMDGIACIGRGLMVSGRTVHAYVYVC